MITTAAIAISAVLLDWVFGEPRRFHPLVGFGLIADQVEKQLNHGENFTKYQGRFAGVVCLFMIIAPFTAITALLSSIEVIYELFSALILYLAIGHRSLYDHARPIAEALKVGDEPRARNLTGRIVSRDPETLDIPKAATESVLENGSDSIFAALFWFAMLGAPGVVIYRLVNTLDAMWGYRNVRFTHFGWAAAKLDDKLNYIPARLTALTYAMIGAIFPTPAARISGGIIARFQRTLLCWFSQAPHWDSPNAGPVMAAGAGALNVSLGGSAIYNGKAHDRPVLGFGPEPDGATIFQALKLVSYSLALWLAVLALTGVFYFGFA